MTTLNPIFHIKLGTPEHPCVYVEESPGVWREFEAYEYFYVKKKLNNTSEFEVKFYDITDTEKVYLKRNANIMFFMGSTKILKGIMRVVKYESGYACVVSGYCNSIKLMDKDFLKDGTARVEYDDTSAQTIAKDILSTGSDGSAPWDMTPDTNGLFDTDSGNAFLRFEYSNKLKCLATLAEGIGYEWEVEQEDDDYDEDIFKLMPNLPSSTRAANSQGTFRVGGINENCEQTSVEEDTQNMANKVTVLGYGDGENQLSTTVYNATPINSTITSDITEATGTIDVADATDFPSAGTLLIGSEQVEWISKFGNSLVGCTRGANGTTAAKHLKGCYLEQYTSIDSPVSGSSIEEFGVISSTYVDRSILNLETLELVASKKLLEKKDPITTIKLIPEDIVDAAETYKLGDLITIDDSESSLSGDYRIIQIDYTSEYGILKIEFTISTSEVTFTSESQKTSDAEESLQKYMQGSTNIYAINEAENCDDSYPLDMKFYVSDETIAINKVKLNTTIEKYRSYSAGAAAGGAINETTTSEGGEIISSSDGGGTTETSSAGGGFNETSSDGGSFNITSSSGGGQSITSAGGGSSTETSDAAATDDTGATAGSYNTTGTATSTWSDLLSMSEPTEGWETYPYVLVWCSVRNESGGSRPWTMKVSPSGIHSTSNEYPDEYGAYFNQYDDGDVTFMTIVPGAAFEGKSLTLEIKRLGASNVDLLTMGHGWQGIMSHTHDIDIPSHTHGVTTSDHTHTVTDSDHSHTLTVADHDHDVTIADHNHTITTADHSHSVTSSDHTHTTAYEITQETFPAGSPTVEIEVGEVGSEVAVAGSPFTVYDGATLDVDISEEVRAVGAGKWCNVKFTPSGGTDHNRLRIEANAYVKLFIHSE